MRVANAAGKVQEAAGKSQEAASQFGPATLAFAGAGALVEGQIDVHSHTAQTAAIKDATDDAAKDSDQAKQAADKAAQESASLLGLAGTVATKLPLLGGAIVFVLLGCAVAGFITISFG